MTHLTGFRVYAAMRIARLFLSIISFSDPLTAFELLMLPSLSA